MRQALHSITVRTPGKGLIEITAEVTRWVREQAMREGLLTLYCRHTSASLLIQENADPDVRHDLLAFFERVAPESRAYRHQDEGPDDMPAHLRAALTATQLAVPLLHGALALGRWQGIYLFEHRSRSHAREIVLHLLGE